MVTAVSDATPTQLLAETLLCEPLDQWVFERRGAGLSWRSIAQELRTCTEGKVAVNRETLRSWYREAEGAVCDA